jgi:hypothetical protein
VDARAPFRAGRRDTLKGLADVPVGRGVVTHQRAKIAAFRQLQPAAQKAPMDVEHINAIGNSLADLTKRTVDLRGYL